MKKATVALIGRPNVGKSTIFNRIAKRKIAIIEDTPGVTRDRIYAKATFENHVFHLVDTGGIDLENEKFNTEIKAQAEIAIDEADVILFIVDGKDGITPNDHYIKDILNKSNKRVIVVINKIDSKLSEDNMYDFYELGFEEYHMVSGEQNEGIYDLLEAVVKDFNEIIVEDDYDESMIKFSLIGRPNVGKSSLVNALVNEKRAIVSEVAGTTRDAIDTIFKYEGSEYVVIDTAGMRKKGKIYENIEKYSFLRSMKAIDRSDVCVLVINAEEGVIEHDKHIASYALEEGKAIIIAVNKWDKSELSIKEFEELVRQEFKFISYAPVVFLSALTKKRIHTLMPKILLAHNNATREIKTSVLNGVVMDAYMLNLPPSYKSKRLKVYFSTQVGIKPPTFNISVNSKGLIHFSYERYLENKIRESFDFEGTPIVLNFKNKGEQYK